MIQAGTASTSRRCRSCSCPQVDHLRLVLPVPESVVPRIRIDAPVEVRVESLKRVFQGRMSRFSGKLDSSTRTMETEVDLPNPDCRDQAGHVRLCDAGPRPPPGRARRSRAGVVRAIVPGHRARRRRGQAPGRAAGESRPGDTRAGSRCCPACASTTWSWSAARANLRPGLLVEPKLQEPAAAGAAH